MTRCPYSDCKQILNNLDVIMDELTKDKEHGQVVFEAPCCKRSIRAYSDAMRYYIVPTDGSSNPVQIGHG